MATEPGKQQGTPEQELSDDQLAEAAGGCQNNLRQQGALLPYIEQDNVRALLPYMEQDNIYK